MTARLGTVRLGSAGVALAASALVVTSLMLAACGQADGGSGEVGSGSAAGIQPAQSGDEGGAGDEQIPAECVTVAIGWHPGVDIADVEAMPGDWPEPPKGSTLCSTSGGDSVETAAYASDLPIEDVFAHYESALPDGYGSAHVSGADTGTGYPSLDGSGPGIAFEIRQNDGGFTLVFAREAS